MYKITTTTAAAGVLGTVENHTATVRLAGPTTFETIGDAMDFAEDFAALRGFVFVRPGMAAPKLKEGETYVEVDIA